MTMKENIILGYYDGIMIAALIDNRRDLEWFMGPART